MQKSSATQDVITIKSIQFHGKHGHAEIERVKGNQFEVDVTAKGYFKNSIKNEELHKTFDYSLAEKTAAKVIHGPSKKLIETLCYEIGEELFSKTEFVTELNVTVRKLNPPIDTPAEYAQITMTWKR
ncbi:dihydroneopterin aldolase [Rhodohalobacter barkolensis]|uniref:7,8-dihydroneopterin aldolase n=1 Tax=Rhodohalobacter barkolensis TaxID=2053187 RepID=A0A2N0VED5_9BACT|nr:dihydroneopterin aldolase [Rhodohalobacter barkolensis]PKD42547.1 dihydroneopterin aldolase [Rhodohalobacter barkolensis]